MNTRVRRRAARPDGAARPEPAVGRLRGRAMPARITVVSCAVLLSGAGLLAGGCSSPGPATATASGIGHAAAGSRATAPNASGQLGPVSQPAAVRAAPLGPGAQSIIYTASLTVRVRDTARAAAAAVSEAAAAGGYTAAEQALARQPGGAPARVSLTLKVPVASYPAVLSRLGGLGRQAALSQQSSDVTQEVADVGSRVTSQQDAIAQLRALLRRAGSVAELLTVQDQISGDESALESLQAQQRALDHETTYATISLLLLSPRPEPAAHRRTGHGFTAGLAAGWRGLRHATAWAADALGSVLPFAVVIAIIGFLAYAGWRRVSRRRTRPGPAS